MTNSLLILYSLGPEVDNISQTPVGVAEAGNTKSGRRDIGKPGVEDGPVIREEKIGFPKSEEGLSPVVQISVDFM